MAWQKFEVTTSENKVPMGQVDVPETFGCKLSEFDDGRPEVELHWQVVAGVPVCRRVLITAVDTEHEVQVSGLAGVRVEDLLEQTIKRLFAHNDLSKQLGFPIDPAKPLGAEALSATRAARSTRRVKITEEVLREVAEVYRANVADKPTQAVAEHFGKGDRAARLYVKRARDKGFLGAAIKGKAGEQ